MAPLERANALLAAPRDGWVALSADESRIVAQGKTCAEVVEAAKRAGETDPVLIKTPPDWSPRVLTFCV